MEWNGMKMCNDNVNVNFRQKAKKLHYIIIKTKNYFKLILTKNLFKPF